MSKIIEQPQQENDIISRPALISFQEFKKTLADHDGYDKTRRIIMFGFDSNSSRYKYMIPMVGRKKECYIEAYRLLFQSTDEVLRKQYIKEGEFKIPISYNFSQAYYV